MRTYQLILSACLVLCTYTTQAQIVINELDSDTPSTDTMEFIELKSDTPEMSLDGFVLVLFNGSTSGNDSSYFSLDLDGFTTDINGIFLMSNNDVSPIGDFILFDSTIQNGADAVAIYQGNASDFPDGTLATTTNLVDALAHDTNDADDTVLLGLLGLTEQINEGENGNQTTESIQRDNDGTYFVATPTPGVLNDGSGEFINGIGFTTSSDQYEEGDSFDIVFTTQENVTETLSFDISLSNGTFNTSDFTGVTMITIPNGENTATTTIQLIDDTDDEGDEILQITFGELPDTFSRLNDNNQIRVIDNDFTVAPWGTPLNPTFDQVESTQPEGYYDSIDGLAGDELVQAIQDIIADPDIVRAQTYTDVIDILNEADQSPLNSNQVWLLYTEQQRPKLDFQTSGGSNVGLWNREHTYPRSRGGFDDIDLDEIADGIDIFFTTEADSLRHANSDAHGLRATDGPENSARGNSDYGEYSGPENTQGSWQGDVARGIFFLTIRYNGLEVIAGNPDNSTVGALGDLDILLDWYRNDPADDYELNRNNVVYTWQFNRNPFIDLPDLAEFIWGENAGEVYNLPLSTESFTTSNIRMYPNPAKDILTLETPNLSGEVNIYTLTGQKVHTALIDNTTRIPLTLSTGIYLVQVTTQEGIQTLRLVVE
ncbi:endonuclease [uncultured Dokdonia sp.]|uniref:endonuclease n=1 Tax=uncultured Dokdonia sp. TaxID=575653 RepID=UPI00260991C9|nr:endonuclease [uncultured Dokdonia sp.]